MKKLEQKLTTNFQKWLKYNWKETAAFEIKVARNGISLNFSEVKEHQVRNLQIVIKGQFIYKISDFDITTQKPFDLFTLNREKAYIVVFFYKKRQPKVGYIIKVDDWIIESKTSKRKSLTEENAQKITYKLAYLA